MHRMAYSPPRMSKKSKISEILKIAEQFFRGHPPARPAPTWRAARVGMRRPGSRAGQIYEVNLDVAPPLSAQILLTTEDH